MYTMKLEVEIPIPLASMLAYVQCRVQTLMNVQEQ